MVSIIVIVTVAAIITKIITAIKISVAVKQFIDLFSFSVGVRIFFLLSVEALCGGSSCGNGVNFFSLLGVGIFGGEIVVLFRA